MMKRTKGGQWRKMTPKAAQAWLNDAIPEGVPAVHCRTLETQAAPSLERKVDVLAESHELADLLVAVRNKVQRIADETPIGVGMIRDASEPNRDALILALGSAVRLSRGMASWVPRAPRPGLHNLIDDGTADSIHGASRSTYEKLGAASIDRVFGGSPEPHLQPGLGAPAPTPGLNPNIFRPTVRQRRVLSDPGKRKN